MAESGVISRKSGADIKALKEALNAQQQLLHKLYAELDQEREASETAASEALSMILRLQGEKAAVEMEAKQYKRMAEEKIFHADECAAIFEEVIYQKDMEIAALECQIQAYKYKLLSLGCNEIDCVETEYNNESIFRQKICGGEGNNAVEPPDIDTYWQQIRKLDERVKGIYNAKELGRKNRGYSLGPLHSQGNINPLNSCLDAVKKQPDFLQASKTLDDSLSSSRVQDIFEVPEVSPSNNVGGKRNIKSEKINSNDENRHDKPESPTFIKSLFKTEPRTCFNVGRKNLDHYNLACPSSAISKAESRTEIEQLSTRMERLERLEQATNDVNTTSEITPIKGEEIGFLKDSLNEIKTQLAKIHSDIKFLKSSKSAEHKDTRFTTLQEEMLHFWL